MILYANLVVRPENPQVMSPSFFFMAFAFAFALGFFTRHFTKP